MTRKIAIKPVMVFILKKKNIGPRYFDRGEEKPFTQM